MLEFNAKNLDITSDAVLQEASQLMFPSRTRCTPLGHLIRFNMFLLNSLSADV